MFKKVWLFHSQIPTVQATKSGHLITCRCGAKVSGLRHPQSQVVRCASCQEELFVLAISPRPVPHGWIHSIDSQVVETKHVNSLPVGWAVAFFLLLGGIAFTSFLAFMNAGSMVLQPESKHVPPRDFITAEEDLKVWSKGPNNESLGKFIDRLTQATIQSESTTNPNHWRAKQALLNQAKACLSVSPVSLEDILAESSSLPSGQNLPMINQQYGRMFVWDAHVLLDSTDGSIISEYRIIGSGIQARIKLGSQAPLLVKMTPNGRRMIFVIQLKGIHATVSGWEAQFENETAILIEDVCFLDVLGIPRDPSVLDVVKNQKDFMTVQRNLE